MKILHLIIRLAAKDGGPPHGLLTLAKAQANLGDDVAILPCTSQGGKPVIEQGVYGNLTVYPAPTDNNILLPNKALKKNIEQLVSEYDIVHLHNSWRYHLVVAKQAAIRAGKPYIVSPEGNMGRIPRAHKRLTKWLYYKLFEKSVLENASAIHCFSQKELDEIRDLNLSPRHFVVSQPVESDLINSKPDYEKLKEALPGISEGDVCILYLGRIVKIKNLFVLVKSFIKIADKIKNSHLVLAGPWDDDNLIEDMKALIESNNLQDRLHLPGMVTGRLRVAVFERATIFAQPSLHESFGISVAEALLMGLPCVVNRSVALSDDIEQSNAGLVFDKSSDIMAEKMEILLTDSKLREKSSRCAKNLANKFDPVYIAKQFREEYQKCINCPR